jgi:hypothetical protein
MSPDLTKLVADTIAKEIADGELDPNDAVAIAQRQSEIIAANSPVRREPITSLNIPPVSPKLK